MHPFAVVALAGLLTACVSKLDPKTAGTQLLGNKDKVRLLWTTDHPWAAGLARANGRIVLIGQYRAESGMVEERLSVGQLSNMEIEFNLPKALRTIPKGSVCLFIAESNRQNAIPIRLDTSRGGDTAKFRHDVWERSIRLETISRVRSEQAIALNISTESIRQELEIIKQRLASRQLVKASDCDRIKSTESSESAIPELIDTKQQNDISQRVCVRRARNMSLLRPEYRVDVHAFASALSNNSYADSPELAKSRAVRYIQHRSQWGSLTGPEYTPEVGSSSEILPVGKVVAEILARFNSSGGVVLSTEGRDAAIGLMEAHSACLEDVEKQVRLRSDAWARARNNRPLREKMYMERLREQCQSDFKYIEELQSSLRSALLHANSSSPPLKTTNETPQQIDMSFKELNGQRCND